MGIFDDFRKAPPRNQHLMIVPKGWPRVPPSVIPAVNITQLGMNHIGDIISQAERLQEGESASFTITAKISKRNVGTETRTITVDFSRNEQAYTYRRKLDYDD